MPQTGENSGCETLCEVPKARMSPHPGSRDKILDAQLSNTERYGRCRQVVKALVCGISIRGFNSPHLPHYYQNSENSLQIADLVIPSHPGAPVRISAVSCGSP